jgi:hypothetical protein
VSDISVMRQVELMNQDRPPGATLIAIAFALYGVFSFLAPIYLAFFGNETYPLLRMIPGVVLGTLSFSVAVGAWRLARWTPSCLVGFLVCFFVGAYLSVILYGPEEREFMTYSVVVGSILPGAVGFLVYRYLRAVTRPAA